MKQIEEQGPQIEEPDSGTQKPTAMSAVKDFTQELFLTINSSWVTTWDIVFGVANLVVKKTKTSVKVNIRKIRDKYTGANTARKLT